MCNIHYAGKPETSFNEILNITGETKYQTPQKHVSILITTTIHSVNMANLQ